MGSAAPVTQDHLSKPDDLMLQNEPLSGNQRPDLLTCLTEMSCVLRLPRDMHLCTASSKVPRLPSMLETATKLARFPHIWQGAESFAPTRHSDD